METDVSARAGALPPARPAVKLSGVVRDPAIIADQSRSYAEAYANRTCPKGYNFYGDGPLGGSRKGVHTYVFQCNQ